MPKFYRVTKTVEVLRGIELAARSDGSKTDALHTLYNNLSGAQQKRLSTAMSMGDYVQAKPGLLTRGQQRLDMQQQRDLEELFRKYKRCLVFVLSFKTTRPFDARLADAVRVTNAISARIAIDMNGVTELQNRVTQEVQNADIQVASIQQTLNELAWAGWDRTVYRPLQAGAAIGQRGQAGPGTLGCFVERNGEIFILSNYHVLKQSMGQGRAGDAEIVQPAHLVGGSYFDVVADYFDGEPTLDAAIARVRRGISCQNRTTGPRAFDINGHSVNVANNDSVQKCGASSGHRRGEVTDAVAFSTPPRNLHGVGITNDNIKIERDDAADASPNVGFQVQGDSGTVVCDMNGAVIGLLNVKHPDGSALATLIDPILTRFNVRIMGVGPVVSPGVLGNLINFRTRSMVPGANGNIIHDVMWESSTNDIEDLAHVETREHVWWPDPPGNANGLIIPPDPIHRNDYRVAGGHYGLGNNAITRGNVGGSNDTHGAMGPFAPAIFGHTGADIVLTFQQEYEMRATRNGIAGPWAGIPNARYRIVRRITALTNDRIRITLTKTNVNNQADSCTNSHVFS
jgi:hypothetical protein